MGLSQMYQTAVKPAHVQQGVAHGTPATRHIHALALGGSGKKKAPTYARRKKASAAPGAAPRRRKTSRRTATAGRSGSGHLVKGSPAAKRHMAKLRAMVGKRKAAA